MATKEREVNQMGEYFKGIMASLAGVLLVILDLLNILNTDTLPKAIALIGGVLAILVPNTINGINVRTLAKRRTNEG
jgi:hypothetical protein